MSRFAAAVREWLDRHQLTEGHAMDFVIYLGLGIVFVAAMLQAWKQ
jgi:hypothetical protein